MRTEPRHCFKCGNPIEDHEVVCKECADRDTLEQEQDAVREREELEESDF
jgi:predicted nucleic acid-binding Zn ribbon protein